MAEPTPESEARLEVPRLETDRLLLRPIREGDAEDLLTYAGQPEIVDYSGFPPYETLEAAEQRVAARINLPFDPSNLNWVIENKESGQVIGECALWHIHDRHRRGELGYVLAPAARGRGYAIEAAEAVLEYAFTKLDLRRVQATCRYDNRASRRVLEGLGMQFEGVLREFWIHNDRPVTVRMYSMLRSGWGSRQRVARR